MKKIIIIVVIVCLVSVMLTLSIYFGSSQKGSLVQVEKVERVETLVSKVSATGEIKPKEFVELQAEITGIITSLNVDEGDLVNRGDILLRIDPTQLELQQTSQEASWRISQAEARNQEAQIRVQESVVERDRAGVRRSAADLEKAQRNYEIAKASFERKQEMAEQRLISKDTYDAAKNDLVSAEANLTSAQVGLEQAKAQLRVSEVGLEQEKIRHQNTLERIEQSRAGLDRSRDDFSKTVIRAPLTGVITQLNVEAGERAVPGTLNNPAATLMIIADLSVIEAEVEVDETDIVEVHLGQLAEVTVDALPDTPLRGRVTEIGSSAIRRSGSSQEAKDFKVVIQLEDPPKALRPGLSCSAEVTTGQRENVLAIPIQALTIREFEIGPDGELVREDPRERRRNRRKKTDSNGNKKVKKEEVQGAFLVQDGKAVFKRIETGITGETLVEAINGLAEDDTIISGSYKILRSLKDGEKIRQEKGRK